MKGFKKDGKFIPTENRKKSSLTKKDIEHQFADDRIGRTLPLTRKKVIIGHRCTVCNKPTFLKDEPKCFLCRDEK